MGDHSVRNGLIVSLAASVLLLFAIVLWSTALPRADLVVANAGSASRYHINAGGATPFDGTEGRVLPGNRLGTVGDSGRWHYRLSQIRWAPGLLRSVVNLPPVRSARVFIRLMAWEAITE